MRQARDHRNYVLELISGRRIYVPPPNRAIIQTINPETTKGGIILPQASSSEEVPAIGRVLAVGPTAGEFWPGCGAPCEVGDVVMFHPGAGLITAIHHGMISINFDSVMLTIEGGKVVLEDIEGLTVLDSVGDSVIYEPSEEEKPTTLSWPPEPDPEPDGKLIVEGE